MTMVEETVSSRCAPPFSQATSRMIRGQIAQPPR